MGSQSYKDLLVWQKSIVLCTQVYRLCEKFPKFLHFLSIANGSLAELDTQRIIATNLNLISQESSNSLDSDITEIRKMLYALRAGLKSKN
jgi:hypothetical protein